MIFNFDGDCVLMNGLRKFIDLIDTFYIYHCITWSKH
jgi:hypothetical protein